MFRPIAVVLAVAAIAPSAAAAQDTTEAYVNEDARELVRLARLRRNTIDRRIEAYGTTARERFSVRLDAGIAEKLVYRRETVTRIDWQRDGPLGMDVLAMREVTPLLNAEAKVPFDMSAELLRLVFDPADPSILLRIDSTEIRHPLADSSETHYRFEAGDMTMIQLPDGRSVRLRELRVMPRRRTPELFNGSLWLDVQTHAVVQAYLKLARGVDSDRGDIRVENGNIFRDAILSAASGLVMPIRADIDFIVLEYGLWDLEWWLPRQFVAKGFVRVNRFRVPMSYELTYEDYTVRADTSSMLDVLTDSLPHPCRERVRFTISADDPARDSLRQSRTDSERAGRERMAERRRVERGDTAEIGECEREFIITAPSDSALLNSPELPPTAYADDIELMSDDELRAIIDRVRSIPRAASFELPPLHWGSLWPRHFRYNRVEGLSLGGGLVFDLGQATLGAEARLGVADRDPRGEITLERRGDLLHSRLAAYRRLASPTANATTLGTVASLGALLFGRDDSDYFDALGGELVVRPPESRTQWYDVRLYTERQRAVERNTDFSVTGLIDSDHTFRENFVADAAEQFGARVRVRAGLGLNPAAPRVAGELSLGAETGDYTILRPEALAQFGTPLPFGLALGVEAAAGTVEGGHVPAQVLWRLGGAPTLRGYPGSSLVGERYWRGRAELAWGAPAMRFTLFSDAAWAGRHNRLDTDGALLSAGTGISLLDGVLRLDLAHGFRAPGSWRLHLHFGDIR